MGLGAQLTAWPIELCEALVDRGFFVIRYDNRDVGRSTKFDDVELDFLPTFLAAQQGEAVEVPYRLTDMAADAVGAARPARHRRGPRGRGVDGRDDRPDDRHRAPERVRTLTSIMSTTGEPEVGQPTPEAMQALLRPPAADRDEAIASGLDTRKLIGSPDHFDEELARAGARGRVRPLLPPRRACRAAPRDRGLRLPGRRPAAARRARPSWSTATPTRWSRRAAAQRTAELIPGAELLVLEGMGHDLPLAYVAPGRRRRHRARRRTAAPSA